MQKPSHNLNSSIQLAKEFSNIVSSNSGHVSLYLGGSSSLGFVDEYSDLDIFWIWNDKPDSTVAKKIYQISQSFIQKIDDRIDAVFKTDSVLFRKKKIDCCHVGFDHLKTMLSCATNSKGFYPINQELAFHIQNSIPLANEERILDLKKMTNIYTEDMKITTIIHLHSRLNFHLLKKRVVRSDYPAYYDTLQSQIYYVLGIICAANSQFMPGMKRMQQISSILKNKPPFAEGNWINEIYLAPPSLGLTLFSRYINELWAWLPSTLARSAS